MYSYLQTLIIKSLAVFLLSEKNFTCNPLYDAPKNKYDFDQHRALFHQIPSKFEEYQGSNIFHWIQQGFVIVNHS